MNGDKDDLIADALDTFQRNGRNLMKETMYLLSGHMHHFH